MTGHPPPPPFEHQSRALEETQDLESYALFWEMGCAKSRVVIDTAAHLYRTGKIRGLLVLAPKAVAPNWVHDELPAHLPVDVRENVRTYLWRSDRSGTKKAQAEMREALAHDGLLVACMNYEGIMTERRPGAARGLMKGKEFAKSMLASRPCMMVLDESARIKAPRTKTTKRVLAAGLHAPYRRILTGTPVSNSPFDVFSQLRFLDPDIWDSRGCRSFEAFKVRYGIWAEHVRRDNRQKFKQLVSYQNLDDLHEVVDSVGSRLLTDDVLDLPPKVYEKRYFQLVPSQRKLYERIRDEFQAELSAGTVTAPLAITRLLRLQQVACGFVPTDDGQLVRPVGPNPRLECLADVVRDLPESAQFIVWAKFREDVRAVAERMREMGLSVVTYDGSTPHDEREEARRAFQAGEVRAFVANPAAAGEGLTLTAASAAIFYSTSFKLAERLQAEGRCHRAGQDKTVVYVDLIAEDTVDSRVVSALREKLDLASIVTGDSLKNWI